MKNDISSISYLLIHQDLNYDCDFTRNDRLIEVSAAARYSAVTAWVGDSSAEVGQVYTIVSDESETYGLVGVELEQYRSCSV